jgi:hypothetical protein
MNKKYVTAIPDYHACSPRDSGFQDNICKIVTLRKQDIIQADMTFECQESLEEYLETVSSEGGYFYPLYVYVHSGVSISMSYGYPYNDLWDSGQVGFVVLEKEDLIKNYSPNLCKDIGIHSEEEYAKHITKAEIDEYEMYLSGDVWCLVVKEICEHCGEEHTIDTICGIYGNYVEEAAKEYFPDIQYIENSEY